MSDLHDIIVFDGSGLNWDDPVERMPKGDGRERRNIIVEEREGRSVISNIKGNKKRALIALPTGTNTVIGATEDMERGACVYMLHNSRGNHCILRYVSGAAENIHPVLWSEPILNFSLTSRLQNLIIKGDLLFWCEKTNPPRKVNMEKARKYTLSHWGEGVRA